MLALFRGSALALAACLAGLAGCSTADQSSPGADASADALQPIGAPCDMSLANACAPSGMTCVVNACVANVCTRTPVEGTSCMDAASLPPPNPLCTTSADCDGGVCGYYVAAGCTATGVCLERVDAGALLPPACTCDGKPDPYVANGFTSAPASSPEACGDGGEDAGLEDASTPDTGASDAAASFDGGDGGSSGATDAAPE